MSRTMQLPVVARIVADLDVPDLTVAPRIRRSTFARLMAFFLRSVARGPWCMRPIAAALVASVLACSDSSDPVTAPRPVASAGVTPRTVVLESGETRQLTAVALDAAGAVVDGRTVRWSTDQPAVATVSATGLVRAVARGYAVITATVDGKSASSVVTVPTPEPATEYDLVYERRPSNGDADIRRLSLATGAITSLPLVVMIPGTSVRDVAPSPDGTRVAFTVAWYPADSPMLDGDIYVANIDGSGLRRLTTTEELDEQRAWSPDGTRIAFRSKRSGNWDIWVINANGTGQVNLMQNVLPATSTETTPAWSPDGARIVYSSDIDTYAYGKLWTMRPDGSDKQRLFPQSSAVTDVDRDPSWSPDGSKIAFRRVSAAATGADLMIATVATGSVTRIEIAGAQAFPAWAPDGSRIAFMSNHEGPLSHIYTMAPDGSQISRYTAGPDENAYPRWLRAAPATRAVAR